MTLNERIGELLWQNFDFQKVAWEGLLQPPQHPLNPSLLHTYAHYFLTIEMLVDA